MKSYIAMSIFAFLVCIISLLRIMSDREFYRLTSMKKVWGRSRGLAMHFVSNVVLPLVCGVVFMSGGVSGVKLVGPLIADKPFENNSVIQSIQEEDSSEPLLEDMYTILAA
jgi:hypothetical protein